MHTVKLFVPESNSFEVEIAIGQLNAYKSPGID